MRSRSLVNLMIAGAIIMALVLNFIWIVGLKRKQLDETRKLAREEAVILNIRAIHAAESQYYTQFGLDATQLSELGPPSGEAGPNGANLIPTELAHGQKSGYLFEPTQARPDTLSPRHQRPLAFRAAEPSIRTKVRSYTRIGGRSLRPLRVDSSGD